MPEPKTNCPYGADSDIDARYLAGKLSPAESEAFEEHYFGCDRCFDAIRRGTEIRAAVSGAPGEASTQPRPETTPILTRRPKLPRWQSALAAAAVVLVVLGIRKVAAPGGASETAVPAPSINAPRGSAASFTLTSHATSAVLVAAWSPPPSARTYRVRLLGTDGSLLFEREIADTSIMLPRDLIRGNTQVYWEVQALDALRSVIATSPAVEAQTSPSPP
jgi:hypothetical protein